MCSQQGETTVNSSKTLKVQREVFCFHQSSVEILFWKIDSFCQLEYFIFVFRHMEFHSMLLFEKTLIHLLCVPTTVVQSPAVHITLQKIMNSMIQTEMYLEKSCLEVLLDVLGLTKTGQ